MPLVGVEAGGDLGDGEEVILLHLPLQTWLLQQGDSLNIALHYQLLKSSSMDVNVTIKACDKCWHSHADRYDCDPNTDVMIYLYFVQHW